MAHNDSLARAESNGIAQLDLLSLQSPYLTLTSSSSATLSTPTLNSSTYYTSSFSTSGNSPCMRSSSLTHQLQQQQSAFDSPWSSSHQQEAFRDPALLPSLYSATSPFRIDPPPSSSSSSSSSAAAAAAQLNYTNVFTRSSSASSMMSTSILDLADRDSDMNESRDPTAEPVDPDQVQVDTQVATLPMDQDEVDGDAEDDDVQASVNTREISSFPNIDHDEDDESSYPPNEEEDESVSEAEDDDVTNLTEWVTQSQRNKVDPRIVLKRLLEDYSHLPLSNKYLWKTCYNLSSQIQERLVQSTLRRQKLSHYNTLDDVTSLIQRSSKIVVLTGAGISVASGIPDFRSKGGIYPRLKKEFGMESPESMFDLDYFKANPAIFYSFASQLWPGSHLPSLTHRFIAKLELEGKLLRNYTQNIDALESRAGIKNVLQCHGSFATASCMTCKKQVHGMEIHQDIINQRVAKCTSCWPADTSTESLEGIDRHCPTYGVMKPNITFFGEALNESFRTSLESDRSEADLVIVIGSSLKVQPVAGMLQMFSKPTPMILINREVVGAPNEFDVEMLGLADEVCTHLCEKLGWTLPEINSNDEFKDHIVDSSAVTSSTNNTPTSTVAPLAAAPSSTPSLPQSPLFLSPNRYCFRGCQLAPSPSPSTPTSQVDDAEASSTPSSPNAQSHVESEVAPAACSSSSESHVEAHDSTASSTTAATDSLISPVHSSSPSVASSSMRSPKSLPHAINIPLPPHPSFDHPSKSDQHATPIADLNLTLTSSRHSPYHRAIEVVGSSCLGKRKMDDTDHHHASPIVLPPPAVASSTASSSSFSTRPPMSPRVSSLTTGCKLITNSIPTDLVQAKRRKVEFAEDLIK